jgi:hypothetical protein
MFEAWILILFSFYKAKKMSEKQQIGVIMQQK